MKKRYILAAGLLLCLILLAAVLFFCCGFDSKMIKVRPAERGKMQAYFYMFTPNGLAFDTDNFLKSHLTDKEIRENPELVLSKLDDYYRISGNIKYPQLAADFCRWMAEKSEPARAVRFYLTALKYCRVFADNSTDEDKQSSGREIYNITLLRMILTYNEACGGVFQFQKNNGLLNHDSFSLRGIAGERFVFTRPVHNLEVPVETVSDLSLCAAFSTENIQQVNRQLGIGAPLVATIAPQKQLKTLQTPLGMTIPVTYNILMKPLDQQTIEVKQAYADLNLTEEIVSSEWGASSLVKLPLAADFTTPLACFAHAQPSRNRLSIMLNRNQEDSLNGLYILEPYNPEKIPVVLIHGLMSSPATWFEMINALKIDPVIRKRYQFWFFYYSSGSPIIVSAHRLKNALLNAQKELCTSPKATENFNKMVLVGHSMGGLITRLLLQKDPHYFAEKITDCSWESMYRELGMPERQRFNQLFCLTPLPFVRRAVFVSVPHRGASAARSKIARFFSQITNLPSAVTKHSRILQFIYRKHISKNKNLPEKLNNQLFTGIDNLDPNSLFIKGIRDSRMKDDLVFHSIIGNDKKADQPGGSDGVVPYFSSHLDGADSELIVESAHSSHRSPAAIREILRILLLHVEEKNMPSSGSALPASMRPPVTKTVKAPDDKQKIR